MLTAFVVTFFALSASVSTVLIAACALAGRPQEMRMCESDEVTLAIAEVRLPYYHLRTSINAQ